MTDVSESLELMNTYRKTNLSVVGVSIVNSIPGDVVLRKLWKGETKSSFNMTKV